MNPLSLPSLGQWKVQDRTNIWVFILHSYSQTRHCHFIVCTLERGRGGRKRARSSWTSGHYWSCGGKHMGSDQMNEWFTQKIFHTVMDYAGCNVLIRRPELFTFRQSEQLWFSRREPGSRVTFLPSQDLSTSSPPIGRISRVLSSYWLTPHDSLWPG